MRRFYGVTRTRNMSHQAHQKSSGSPIGIVRSLVIMLLSGALVLPALAKPKGGIGNPKPEGTAEQKGDTWTITGGGADIWGPSDQFHFVSYTSSGNCTLTVKIVSVGDASTHDWAKAGIMIRADESVGSPHALISVSKCNAIEFIWRNVPGADCRSEKLPNMSLPLFLKLARTGNDFTASYSQDGKSWNVIGGPRTLQMKASALAGMAVTSHADGTPCTGVFSNFSMKR